MKDIIEIFNEQVKKNPDNIAVVFKENKLTYYKLDKESSALANFLIENFDIQTNDIIPIMLPRSEKIIISILGILKAGAAYTIISDSYPKNRQKEIIEELNPKIILNNELFIKFQKSKNLYSNEINKKVDEDSLFYLIYTSGTTGKPKGVLHTRKSVAYHL